MKTNHNRILVPSNGSKACEDAFRWACHLAKRSKSELHSIYISEIPFKYHLNSESELPSSDGEFILSRIEKIASEEKYKVQAQLLKARQAGPAIALEAANRNMDMIIVGIPYKQPNAPRNIGTTTSYLLDHARCELILWREPTLSDIRRN